MTMHSYDLARVFRSVSVTRALIFCLALCLVLYAFGLSFSATADEHHPALVTFDVPGSIFTGPASINTEGVITGFYGTRTAWYPTYHGFLRARDGTITSFDVPGAANTYADSINAEGAIAGSYNDANSVTHGFIRDKHGAITSFDVPGATATIASSINAEGVITGLYSNANGGWHGFVRDKDGVITTFDPTDINSSNKTEPCCINDHGEITGTYSNPNWVTNGSIDLHGFIRDKDGTITIFDPTPYPAGLWFTSPLSINAEGVIVGGYTAAWVSHGFIRGKHDTITVFDVPGATATSLCCINDDGLIGGGYRTPNNVWYGLVRDKDGVITSFDVPGAANISPSSMNSEGVIVGTYMDQSGSVHGFLWTARAREREKE
jgi:hypothetical protein